MYYIGIDLHKRIIVVCVLDGQRKVVKRQTFRCSDADQIEAFFLSYRPYAAAVEATANYQWLWQLLERSASQLVLVHPGKLRIIAESVRKSDKVDAFVLAEFLQRDMLPQAYRATPSEREHRILVRYRVGVQQRITGVKCRIRAMLADRNLDRPNSLNLDEREKLKQLELPICERFVLRQLLRELRILERLRKQSEVELKAFVKRAPEQQTKARAALRSIPGVGPLTVEAVLAELGDPARFGSIKDAMAYSGLIPGKRESAGKSKDLPITKQGSKVLRWTLVEAAWRLIRQSDYWRAVYEGLKKRRGARRGARRDRATTPRCDDVAAQKRWQVRRESPAGARRQEASGTRPRPRDAGGEIGGQAFVAAPSIANQSRPADRSRRR